MSGTMKSCGRWMLLALGAAMAAASAGCVAPAGDTDPDEVEEVATSDQSLGAVTTDDGVPQQVGGGAVQSGDVLPGQDCSGPEPQPWKPDRTSDDSDDGDGDDGDVDRDALSTMASTPSGGHHGH